MAESFEQLRAEFLAETEDTLQELQRDLNELEQAHQQGPLPETTVDRVFRTTHSLKGVAGMFGLSRMSEVSHALENVFEDLRRGTLELDAELLDLLHRGNGLLHDLLASAEAPDAHRDEAAELIEGIQSALGARRPEEVPGDDVISDTFLRLDAGEQDGARAAAADGRTIVVVEAHLSEGSFETPFRQLLAAIREWGRVHGTVSHEDDAEARTFRVRLLVSGPDEVFPLMKSVGPLGGEVHFGALPGNAVPAESGSSGTTKTDAPSPEASSAGPEPGPAPTSDAPTAEPRRSSTLRVPVERIDHLLNELGDLMQAKMILDETADAILETVPDRMSRTQVSQSLRGLDRHLRRLQDRILGVRLIGLDPLFQRLERTFRDACRVTGKDARLETRGGARELDKEIVDALSEPLVHLVRNAVDHGVEDPDVRAAAGKSPMGTVTIAARTEGPNAIIEVSDDGAGMDYDRILARGRERGLVGPDEVPTPAELRELLFHAGFTVKNEATEISGRGVGLDAVRESVNRIGGAVEIDETRVGTLFRLRVPITLSILPALEVEAGGQPVFLPLAHVRRVLRVAPGALDRLGERTVYLDGDRAVPCTRLDEVLAGRTPDGTPEFGVLLGLADRRCLLRVERVGRRREVVVRSLGDLLPDVPGVAGCTELGDGRTLLILDAVALFAAGPTAVTA